MKLLHLSSFILIAGFAVGSSNARDTQGELSPGTIALAEAVHEILLDTNDGYREAFAADGFAKERMIRSVSEDIQKHMKEFTAMLQSMPQQFEEMNRSIIQLFKERGLSTENVEKTLKDLWSAMQRLVDTVTKAISVAEKPETTQKSE